ncbi:MAG: AAA family ATPase [Firmicutes bacterium]|nr:AAA family ATPase [Bacillota bacterium]MCL1953993.1 AAA family ATPase [Bacillota bacterium]
MSKVIAFSNQKGGVGKTTTCINLSATLAALGKKVLLVDIDPQGNASSGLGIQKSNQYGTIYDLLIGDCIAKDAIKTTSISGLHTIPSTIDLAGAEIELYNKAKRRDKVLKNALSPIVQDYEYIMIDCPPSLGLLTINALTVANSVLVPLQGEFYALEGITQLMNTINLVKQHYNPNLEIEGIVLTMYDPRSLLAQSVLADLTNYFKKLVYETKIPRNIRLSEAPSYGLPILQFDPRSTGNMAYLALAKEFLIRNNEKYKDIGNLSAWKMK